MGEYVAKELKKVKASLSAFELLQIPAIRNAFFRSLNGTTPSKPTQDTTTKKVSFDTYSSEPIIREILRAKLDQPPSKHQQLDKQLAKEKNQM